MGTMEKQEAWTTRTSGPWEDRKKESKSGAFSKLISESKSNFIKFWAKLNRRKSSLNHVEVVEEAKANRRRKRTRADCLAAWVSSQRLLLILFTFFLFDGKIIIPFDP